MHGAVFKVSCIPVTWQLGSAVMGGLFAAGVIFAGFRLMRRVFGLSMQVTQSETLNTQYRLLCEVFELIHGTYDRDLLCQSVLRTVMEIIPAEAVCLAPYRVETRKLGEPFAKWPLHFEPPMPDTILSQMRKASSPAKHDPVRFETGLPFHLFHGIAFPVHAEQSLLGVLLLYSTRPLRILPKDLILLQALCRQTGIALNRIQLQWEQGRAEARFGAQWRLTRSLTENLSLGVLAVNSKDELLFMNATAETLLGWSQRELKDQALLRLVLADLSRTEDDACNVEAHLMKKNGDYLSVYCASAPILMDQQAQGMVHVFYDLSNRKQHEAELKQYAQRLEESNQALEQFVYLASHDLQAPVIKLKQFGDMLNDKALPDEEARDIVRRMQRSAQHMQELIQNILTLAKISTQRKPFEAVDLNRVVRQVLTEYEDQIRALNAELRVEPLPVVSGDASLLQLLVKNLLDNALKFHRVGVIPEISICCEYPESRLCRITFKDNGIGFSKSQATRIFNMFERLHGLSQYSGSGIGLSLCQKIVERHQGSIMACGELGKGAQFIITLPVRQAPPLPEMVPALSGNFE